MVLYCLYQYRNEIIVICIFSVLLCIRSLLNNEPLTFAILILDEDWIYLQMSLTDQSLISVIEQTYTSPPIITISYIVVILLLTPLHSYPQVNAAIIFQFVTDGLHTTSGSTRTTPRALTRTKPRPTSTKPSASPSNKSAQPS